MEIRDVLDLTAVDAGETLTEGARLAIGPIDRCIERDLGSRHLLGTANSVRGFLQQSADFVVSWIALENLGENCLCAGELDQLGILVERDPHAPCLLCQCLQYCLPDPPNCVRDEFDALIRIELSYRLEQPFVTNRDELTKVESVALVLLHVRDNESKVGGDQPLCCFFIPGLRSSR